MSTALQHNISHMFSRWRRAKSERNKGERNETTAASPAYLAREKIAYELLSDAISATDKKNKILIFTRLLLSSIGSRARNRTGYLIAENQDVPMGAVQ
jgi:hypothetical protein